MTVTKTRQDSEREIERERDGGRQRKKGLWVNRLVRSGREDKWNVS